MSPLVTVGVPFFNEERWLEKTIRSILRQSASDLELLLIDDGSTDRSLEIARSFDDPRVRVTSDGRRRYLAARLNQVAEHARGRYVARMDADDVAHPARLERQLDLLARGPHDAVGCWVGLIDESGRPFAVIEADVESLSAERVLEAGVLPHPTLVAERSWFLANRYDERLTRAQDRDLWCRTFRTTRYGVVKEPLYALRVDAAEDSFVPTYLETLRQTRALFRRHGPEMIGRRRTAELWAKSLAKSGVMRVASAVGLVSVLTHRRGRRPTPTELALLEDALRHP